MSFSALIDAHKIRYFFILSMIGIVLTILCGCEEVDDQTKVSQEQKKIVNPTPSVRDFVKNNSAHKILLAVIDSGTDYNHPQIINNIHFDLDNKGNPIGVGFDFTGNDKWPAPYIARTADIDPDAPLEESEKAARGRKNATLMRNTLPKFSQYLEPERNLEQEQSEGVTHGTHVGGLMVYDAPALGLLVYRVLPNNIVFKSKSRDYSKNNKKTIYENIKSALKMAVASGARVINMSLSISTKKDGGSGGLFSSSSSESELIEQAQRINELKEIIKANPNVAFVAAAGNENGWIDGDAVMQIPCGINLPNVLCVGALDKQNKLASFSNIILSHSHYLAAPGVDVISLFPTKMCDTSSLNSLNSKSGEYPFENPDQTSRFFRDIEESCSKTNGLKKMSGTSMASPIAARALGLIFANNPNLSGDEAISTLIQSGEKFNVGDLRLTRIRVARPNWYPTNNGQRERLLNPTSTTASGFSNTGYFDFYTPSTDEI